MWTCPSQVGGRPVAHHAEGITMLSSACNNVHSVHALLGNRYNSQQSIRLSDITTEVLNLLDTHGGHEALLIIKRYVHSYDHVQGPGVRALAARSQHVMASPSNKDGKHGQSIGDDGHAETQMMPLVGRVGTPRPCSKRAQSAMLR